MNLLLFLNKDVRSRAEWVALLEGALEKPLREVHALLTQDAALQSWLQQAAFAAAMTLSTADDPTGWAACYDRLQQELERTFPELVAAVHEVTEGCGHLRLIWRDDAPQLSTVVIDFGRDYTVDLFLRLPAATLSALEQVFNRIAAWLPPDVPYPRRPHTLTALVAYQGRCPALRLLEHSTSEGLKRTVQLLLPDQPPSSELTPEVALHRLHRYWATT